MVGPDAGAVFFVPFSAPRPSVRFGANPEPSRRHGRRRRPRPDAVLDAVHARTAQFKAQPAPARARRGHVLLGRQRAQGARRVRRPVVRQCRPRRASRSPRRSRAQAAELDYAPAFQFGHPKAFELASRVAALAPQGMDHVFFTNSGSEAVDTALKIARAYLRAIGAGPPLPPDRPRDAAITASTSAASRSAAWSTTARPSALLVPGTDDHLPLPYDRAKTRLHQGRARRRRELCRRAGAHLSRCTTPRPSPR